MKKSILTAIVIFITFTSMAFSQSNFSSESRFTDIIVKVERGVLELPHQLNQASPAQIGVGDPDLSRFLARNNVQLVLRSFPEADPADTLIVNEFGSEIRLLDRTRIFRLRFPNGTELEGAAKELQNISGIIFAETITSPCPTEPGRAD